MIVIRRDGVPLRGGGELSYVSTHHMVCSFDNSLLTSRSDFPYKV